MGQTLGGDVTTAQRDIIPGVGRRTDPVRLRTGSDLGALELSPEEGFLLSRVDGCANLGELLLSAGLPEARTIELVKSLRKKGLLEAGDAAPAEVPAPEPAPPRSRYDGFIFNPADLAEDVALDDATRKEVLFLQARGAELNHYDVLQVRPRTPPEAIRNAYFEASRRFHPDRYYGKPLGSYKARLAQVFQRVTEAYQVLSDPAQKAQYDKVTDLPLDEDELAELARRQERQMEEARRTRERRERLRKRSPFAARKEKASSLLGEAERAEARADWRQAASLYQLAASYDPGDARLAARAQAADEKARALRAEELGDKAVAAAALGNAGEAERLLRQAMETEPGEARWAVSLGRALLRRGQPEAAEEPARKAVAAASRSAEVWTLLGQVLLARGEKKEAKTAFQRAVSLDETADEAKEALKTLRWSLF